VTCKPRILLFFFVCLFVCLFVFFIYGSKFNYSLKLSAIVPRVLSKDAFISGRSLRLSSSSLFIFNEHLIYHFFFQSDTFKGKRYESTLERLFEDCVGPSKNAKRCLTSVFSAKIPLRGWEGYVTED